MGILSFFMTLGDVPRGIIVILTFITTIATHHILSQKNIPNVPTFGNHGVPEAIRTPGLSLRRRSLYPAELRKHLYALISISQRTYLRP